MKLQNDFLDALLKEITLRSDYLEGHKVNTIYFGGGTPSLLSGDDLQRIMEKLGSAFIIDQHAEITLEANPDDIDHLRPAIWTKNGINRLSVGIQSFFDEDLLWMNRAHTAYQASDCIRYSQEAGFQNISIDLIYGGPTLSDDHWMQNMETATSMKIPHLSCYALTVEKGTALDVMIKNKKVLQVNHEDQARQFLMMTDFMASKGYEHYEISNFSLPGMRSRHNSAYWNGAAYIGLGPSSHSFNGTSRQWNVANNSLYIKALSNNKVPFEQETLSETQRLNEYIMTSLRTIEGTDIMIAKEKFGKQSMLNLIKSSQKYIERGWMENLSDRLVLTKEGKLFADGIASDLFQVT